MRWNNSSAFTLIEVMAVIVIIGIMSVFFVVNMRPDTIALLRMDTTRLAADIRYVRSMAATRATYNGSFPSNGYGIFFHNGDGTAGDKSYYKLYAGSTSNVLKTVTLANVAFRLVDPNYYNGYEAAINATGATGEKRFVFKTENIFEPAGFYASATGEYQIDIYYGFLEESLPIYYKSTITIGQKTSDDFTWSNLSTTYDTNRPVCGNDVIELGEACEPTVNGVSDPSCRPDCIINTCGDSYIMQSETCEIVDGLDRDNYLECPNIGWLYSCLDINSHGDCGGLVDPPNCCPSHVHGYCLDCQWLGDIDPLPCI
ncbi:MAG: prepilin-type N-terminal cleavage/methylation domain-containing protein [Patescibacteria group bacterium]